MLHPCLKRSNSRASCVGSTGSFITPALLKCADSRFPPPELNNTGEPDEQARFTGSLSSRPPPTFLEFPVPPFRASEECPQKIESSPQLTLPTACLFHKPRGRRRDPDHFLFCSLALLQIRPCLFELPFPTSRAEATRAYRPPLSLQELCLEFSFCTSPSFPSRRSLTDSPGEKSRTRHPPTQRRSSPPILFSESFVVKKNREREEYFLVPLLVCALFLWFDASRGLVSFFPQQAHAVPPFLFPDLFRPSRIPSSLQRRTFYLPLFSFAHDRSLFFSIPLIACRFGSESPQTEAESL